MSGKELGSWETWLKGNFFTRHNKKSELFAFETEDVLLFCFAKDKEKPIKICDRLIYGTEIYLQVHDDVLLDHF